VRGAGGGEVRIDPPSVKLPPPLLELPPSRGRYGGRDGGLEARMEDSPQGDLWCEDKPVRNVMVWQESVSDPSNCIEQDVCKAGRCL